MTVHQQDANFESSPRQEIALKNDTGKRIEIVPYSWAHFLKPKNRLMLEFGLAAAACTAAAYWRGYEGLAAVGAMYVGFKAAKFCVEEGIKEEPLLAMPMFMMGGFFGFVTLGGVIGFLTMASADPKADAKYDATWAAIDKASVAISNNAPTDTECIPYFTIGPWGGQGKKLGESCVTLDNIHRDRDNFYGTVTVNGEKPYTQMFRPQNSMVPGYEQARIIPEPPGVN